MALDFTGIDNVEFYSGHYLTAVLDGDLKATLKRWKQEKEESGRKLPEDALNGIANRYFDAYAQAADSSDPVERLQAAQDFHAYLLEALGFERRPGVEPLSSGDAVPVSLSLDRDGRHFLWVLEAPFPEEEDADPLLQSPRPEQLPEGEGSDRLPKGAENGIATWRELLDGPLFRQDHPPRWVLFLAGSEGYLIEGGKWPQGRYLRFRFGELFQRREKAALRAVAGLLHKDVLAPDDGVPLHDTLEENSHKHAYAVSGDLKHGVRRAVELLANEAVWYRREVQKKGVFNEEELAPKLTSECLTWLYRMLFLFYVEARGSELGVVPMRADAYRNGYSLEALRDLELVALTTEGARNGYFLHDSLRRLFEIVNQGFGVATASGPQEEMLLTSAELTMDALSSPLFDDERLEILKGVRFRNHVLQEVVQLLSLSAEKKKKTRGRISYAQLGINQLGAVYEGLLSYTGFFATEDLYEVASEKDCKKLSGKPAAEREALKTYFVPASRIGDYKEDEIVKDENERKVVHKKGTFIFRLAGRNREKSGSYYTPEVLTRCLVKYALKELLWEGGEEGAKPTRKRTADEILALTICEPAMGSSAFLIEAVDQLADAYLEARQEEVKASGGETIPPEDYQREKRRVKARLATNNCYGVDLNPTAVELAKVSLWLATLHEDGKCPWFGLRLATGNSLVGARREVFKTADVTRKKSKAAPNWLGLVPEPVPLYHGEDGPPLDEHWTAPPRPKGTIYHFLLPAEGMAAFDKDKVIKQLAPESVKRIKEWRKEFCKPFNTKDAERLEQISDAVDRLFAQVVRERVLAARETSDRISVWGEPPGAEGADLLVRDQEEVAAALEDGSSAYRRLKLAMDAWCALWFWPIEEAGLLPDRAPWLAQLELILKGQVTTESELVQEELFPGLASPSQEESPPRELVHHKDEEHRDSSADRLGRLRSLSRAFRERRGNYFEECGLADIDALLEADVALETVQRTANEFSFHHWPIRFAEVLAERGGFDLILGNPPWRRADWVAGDFLTDFEPRIALRNWPSHQVSERALNLIAELNLRIAYLSEFVTLTGAKEYYGSTNFSDLSGVRANTYKCFILAALNLGSRAGVVGLLHPEGVYDDPRGGNLRTQLYPRLSARYQFINELKLFEEVHHLETFSINVYQVDEKPEVHFDTISDLYHPSTIDLCHSHDGKGPVPAPKDKAGNWDLRAHRKRILGFEIEDLGLFGVLFDSPAAKPLEARLPSIRSIEMLRYLKCMAAQPKYLRDTPYTHYSTTMWNETNAQVDGIIRRDTRWAKEPRELILQGPHFFVGTPIYKTPNDVCETNLDYTPIDLLSIEPKFFPRTNYVQVDRDVYDRALPQWKGSSVTNWYRLANREYVPLTGHRTLVPCVIPPGVGHIYTVVSTAFESEDELLLMAGATASIPYDAFVRTLGKDHIGASVLEMLPLPDTHVLKGEIQARALMLNAVTEYYRDLWLRNRSIVDAAAPPLANDRRWTPLRDWSWARWQAELCLHTELVRRHLLVELDVLTAIVLGLTIDELCTLYRDRFAVLGGYEAANLYDQQGQVVPTARSVRGQPSVNLVELGSTLKEQAGFDVRKEYLLSGPDTNELSEQKVKLGKKEADVLGVPQFCTVGDLLGETTVRWYDQEHPEGRPVRLVGLRYTDPGLEPRMERVYPTPWTRCDREADYSQAWAEFERRLGKKMPEGTPL